MSETIFDFGYGPVPAHKHKSEVAEPLLRSIEDAVQKALDAGVDADWILPRVERVIYGSDED